MTGQQLKNSILQMAIQGKLVPQNPEDEPASVLLDRIRSEKKKLVKSGAIKKDKNESVIFRRNGSFFEKIAGKEQCIDDEIPFDIPDGWSWCRLSSFGEVLGGKRIPAGRRLTRENTGHIYIRVSDMKDGTVCTDNLMYVPLDIYPSIAQYIIRKEDIFITVAGTIGRIGKIPLGLDGANLTENADRIVLHCVNQEWLIIVLQSPFLQKQISDVTTKVGQPKLAIMRICNFLIPLPPLSEQKRIVDKLNEVLPLVDEYGKLEKELDDYNTSFPEQMKKSILQYAVEGKLVPQNPEDEPASVLLDRIRSEKKKLVKSGAIKKDKNESVIFRRNGSVFEKIAGKEQCIDDEIPFDIPECWEWVRLGTVCKIARGSSPRPIKQYLTEFKNGVNWIKIGDTDKEGKYINSTKERITPEGAKKSRMVYGGDFLLTNSMSFGRPYILNIDGCIHDGWLVLSGYQGAYDKDFLFYMLSSKFAYYQFCDVVSGAVVKNLNSDKVSASIFPLPPLSEQKRIVDKLNEVLPLIEKFGKC